MMAVLSHRTLLSSLFALVAIYALLGRSHGVAAASVASRAGATRRHLSSSSLPAREEERRRSLRRRQHYHDEIKQQPQPSVTQSVAETTASGQGSAARLRAEEEKQAKRTKAKSSKGFKADTKSSKSVEEEKQAKSTKAKSFKRFDPSSSKKTKTTSSNSSKTSKTSKGVGSTPTPSSSPLQSSATPTLEFDGKSRIQVTIPASLRLQRFGAINDATSEVLRETIRQVAKGGLEGEGQRVTDVLFKNIDDAKGKSFRDEVPQEREGGFRDQKLQRFPGLFSDGLRGGGAAKSPPPSPCEGRGIFDCRRVKISSTTTVEYELVLQVLCTTDCHDRTESTTMYAAVTSHVAAEIENGGFTRALRAFADDCSSEECNAIREASVVSYTFEDGEIVALTDSPTVDPTKRAMTASPMLSPTFGPSLQPTVSIANPTASPAASPTTIPTSNPTTTPAATPTTTPTTSSTFLPSQSSLAPSAPKSLSFSPSLQPTITNSPMSARPSTAAPTHKPNGAIYFRGFEQGSFGLFLEWNSTGDALWERTSEEAASGVFSMRSPNLTNTNFERRTSSITLQTAPEWGAGTLHYSQYAATEQPYDSFELLVDGTILDGGPNRINSTGFEDKVISLDSGVQEIMWAYVYNPNSLLAMPPDRDDRIAAVFLDNVYFAPSSTASPSSSLSLQPTITNSPMSARPSTAASTYKPDGAIYFRGFEQGSFGLFPEWNSTGDALWERTSEEAASGVFSMRSPNLTNTNFERRTSNIILQIGPEWGAGILHYSLYSAVRQPFDHFKLFVDGEQRGGGPNTVNTTGFEDRVLSLRPGLRTITWAYQYNPNSLPAANLPPDTDDRTAAVFIDNVYFDPFIDPPTAAPNGDINSSLRPSTSAPTATPDEALSFNGFEQGSLDVYPEWTSVGDAPWGRTNERAASSVFSLRSPDLKSASGTPLSSNVTFQTDQAWTGGILHFSISVVTQMPRDEYFFFVDGATRFRGPSQGNLASFEERQIALSSGPHEITWSYVYNPVQLESQNLPPESNERVAAVFLDNVYFVPLSQTLLVNSTTSPSESAPPSNGIVSL